MCEEIFTFQNKKRIEKNGKWKMNIEGPNYGLFIPCSTYLVVLVLVLDGFYFNIVEESPAPIPKV